MRQLVTALLASTPLAIASQTVFSPYDDILAFPQYELVLSDSFISESEAETIIQQAPFATPDSTDTKSLASHDGAHNAPHSALPHVFDPSKETHELMYLDDEPYLCIIPIVTSPVRNETSEKLARAAEAKELARATDRGWELLQELDGNCLYYQSGWWTYSFCYNKEITQFHQLPPQPGNPQTPQRDTTTKQFLLGKSKGVKAVEKQDEWGNVVATQKGKQGLEPPKTELQVKGDTRYLVQRMDDGTVCDLTGKPRKVEIQFHCNPRVDDRIGFIKELTTCSYQMVVWTPRLCNDVAFLPPKVEKANKIECRPVVEDDELAYRTELAVLEASLEASAHEKPIMIGGLALGAGKWINKDGQRMPIPANFGKSDPAAGVVKGTIAKAKSKEQGGEVEIISDKELKKLDLDPEDVEQLKEELKRLAKEKAWKIEIVDQPGEERTILGIVETDDEEGEEKAGSEEAFYKDEL